MDDHNKFSLAFMRDFVPEKLRPWIIILIAVVFQFSGGVYLAAVSEMGGALALKQEDIMMAGYASMVSMALSFAILFRLKFRFPPRTSLSVCAVVIVLANLICLNTGNVVVLVGVSFIAGFFRMWGTFECNSSLQLWITPKRDLSIFFCYIFLMVNACIQLSGLTTVHIATWINWQYMHWFVIALLLGVLVFVLIGFRDDRLMKYLPLYGIDWLGGALWGITVLAIVFVGVYGEHYDWFSSPHIRMASFIAVVSLLLNISRALVIRHPYLDLSIWTYRPMWLTFVLYIVIDFLLAPQHVLEHIYMEGILKYDALHLISLNWIVLLGIVAGAIFTYYTFALRKWGYKRMLVFAMSCVTAYLLVFYFHLDYNLPKEALYLPVFLRGMGYVVVAICFLTALSGSVPFRIFFHAVTTQTLVSATLGGVIGNALLGRILNVVVTKNTMLLSGELDDVHAAAAGIPLPQLYGIVRQQAMMVSMKEIFGWLVLLALFCLLIFILKESSLRMGNIIHPKFSTIRRLIKHELRIDRIFAARRLPLEGRKL
ncbi:hypothetical protein [Odoribacter sp. AF15-53]|uniref:hypothetical protein n=1 Tax=Odoribacter sp. AF15-53 TaxID=2292236 RepID=UPI000E49ACD8|nr:hypothetical protein [Odoribacter sp. AF15-53]RHR78452.1 hypothetical protein DWW52_12665 [Odoribacter sp. AF15-53]